MHAKKQSCTAKQPNVAYDSKRLVMVCVRQLEETSNTMFTILSLKGHSGFESSPVVCRGYRVMVLSIRFFDGTVFWVGK